MHGDTALFEWNSEVFIVDVVVVEIADEQWEVVVAVWTCSQ
jgi:hypothetical protein